MLARPLSFRIVAAGITVFTAVAVYAQPTPPRDRPPPPPTGTARIKGRVVDAQTGSVVARARVRIMGPAGNRPLILTDDNGAFEFAELPPGNFFLSVDRSGYGTTRYPEQARTMRGNKPLTVADGQTLTGVTLPLYRGAAITGRIVDTHGDPAEYVQIQVLRVPAGGRGAPQQRGGASTNDLGEFRAARLEPGAYLLLALQRNQQPGDDPSETGSVPTYYPGVASLDQAQPIAVERAQTITDIEFMLIDATTSVVSGTVVDLKGQPASGGSIQVRRVSTDFRDFGSFGGPIRQDGTFNVKLSPGEYEIEAHGARLGVTGSLQSNDELFGLARVSVAGAPISDLTIQLAGGAVVTGRMVFEGDSPLPTPQQLRINLNSTRDSMCRNGRSETAADWTFRIDGAFGTCTLPPIGTGRWTIKRAMQNDADLLDLPLKLTPGHMLRDVQIVFTDRRSELTLQVTDDHALATREYVALVFPHDKTKWTENSRFVRVYVPQPTPPAAPPTSGPATVVPPRPPRPDSMIGLPPGDYYAVAFDDLPVEGSREASVLETLVADAVSVTVTDGSPVQVTLKRRPFRR